MTKHRKLESKPKIFLFIPRYVFIIEHTEWSIYEKKKKKEIAKVWFFLFFFKFSFHLYCEYTVIPLKSVVLSCYKTGLTVTLSGHIEFIYVCRQDLAASSMDKLILWNEHFLWMTHCVIWDSLHSCLENRHSAQGCWRNVAICIKAMSIRSYGHFHLLTEVYSLSTSLSSEKLFFRSPLLPYFIHIL